MSSRFTHVLLLVCAVGLAYYAWPAGELRHGPGVTAPREPLQTSLIPIDLPERHGWSLQAVALYEVTARILHTKRYWGRGRELVPEDVVLGWGRMSDEAILDRLDISQGNRFFFYGWHSPPPLPPAEMAAHAANTHLIAATDEVASAVSALRRGAIVTMRGYLVNAQRSDGSRWHTSLSRTDTGNGACELFYVEELQPAVIAAGSAIP